MQALEEIHKKHIQTFVSTNWQMGPADRQWKKLNQAKNNPKNN